MPNQLTGPDQAPLASARTVFVQATTGNDATGDGSSAHPWQTLARAWADRLTYGELRAVYTIQLLGVGPFTMPVMGASVCGVGGAFIVQGDSTVDTIAISGTFTGDIASFVLPTSAGLGVDTQKGKFLWITSGACSGSRMTILSNTDTSITVSSSDFRTALGAIVNGDTFQIRVPGSVINVPAAASGQATPGCYDWIGGTTTQNNPPLQHIFINISLTGSLFKLQNAAVTMLGVASTAGALQAFESKLRIGGVPNSNFLGIGANSNTGMLTGYGISQTGGSISIGSIAALYIAGLYCTGAILIGSASLCDVCVWAGGRVDAAMQVAGRLETQGSYNTLIRGTITADSGQILLNAGTWAFNITSGQCLLARRGAHIIITTGITLSGNTTDAASVAMNAVSGSQIILVNRAPALTGVGGADIKAEGSAAIANAALSANGLSTTDAATLAVVMRCAA